MSFYPRRNVDSRGGWFPSIFGSMNPFNMMPSTMSNIFDPINLDIDRLLDRSLHWINVPTGRQQQQQTRQRQIPRQQQSSLQQQRQQQQLPKQKQHQQQTRMQQMQTQQQTQQQQQVLGKMPQKFRILIDCSSCDPRTLKTHIKTVNDQKHLIVCADEQKVKKCETTTPYACNKQFKRTYTLPKQVDVNKMISFVTPNGQFVVEFPLQEVVCCLDIDMVPKIEKSAEGRIVSLRVPIPASVDPSKVTLTAKGRDVILRFEDRFGMEDCVSRVYFYNRCTLPDSTDLNKIKCCADKHRLVITAPLRTDSATRQSRNIPIQRKIRHKTLLATGEREMGLSGISSQNKQSISTQQQQKKNVLSSSSSKISSSRSKSPLTTSEQQRKSSIKTEQQKQKSPIKSSSLEQQKSPIKDTTSNIGKKQKKSTTTTGETGSDILKSVFGSGSGQTDKEKKQKSKSSGELKSEFPLLPSDSKPLESHHQQQ